jgi:hypothetical protein
MTGKPMTAQRLMFQAKEIKFEDTLEKFKITSGVVVNCFPKPTSDEEEAEAMRHKHIHIYTHIHTYCF